MTSFASQDAPTRRSRRFGWLWIAIGIIAVLLAAAGALALAAKHLATQAFTVRDELAASKEIVATIPALAQSGDAEALDAASAQLRQHSQAALAATEDPLWEWVEQVPAVGQNLIAVRKTTAAVDVLVEQAVPVAAQLLAQVDIDRFAITGGRIDVDAFEAVLPLIPELRAAVNDAYAEVDGIDRAALLPLVDDSIGELLDALETAAPALNEAERVLPVVLDMLGRNETRNYLLMFQNNAEVRATGGNPAALALLRVENGTITLPEQSGSQYLAGWKGADLELGLPPEMLQLYEPDFVPQMMNYTRTPDFPTSARMMSALWQQEIGGTIDGVLSIDPVALQYLLAVAGPVTLSDGVVIDGTNAADELLGQSYLRHSDPRFLDDYFADAAQRIFAGIMSGGGDAAALLDALIQGVDDHRVMAWMTREGEQALVAEYNATGTFVPDNIEVTQVGIFLVDSGYGKLQYWLSSSVKVMADTCATGEGPATITTSITLTSGVPQTGASNYQLTLRAKRLGIPRTTMVLDVLFFGPVGGQITGVDPAHSDWRRFDRSGFEQNRPAQSITIGLAAGQTRTVTYTSTADRSSIGAPGSTVDVRTTPLIGTTPVTIEQKPCSP